MYWWVWMVVRFVCVFRVSLCARVSRVLEVTQTHIHTGVPAPPVLFTGTGHCPNFSGLQHVAQLERHAAAALAPTCVLCTSVPWHICRLLP